MSETCAHRWRDDMRCELCGEVMTVGEPRVSEQLSFGIALAEPNHPADDRIATMWAVYGFHEGETCGTCKHLVTIKPGANKYYKCGINRVTHGPATDWRVRYVACGKWEAKSE